MDPNSRPIVFSLVALLGFTILALVASVVIPFDVEQPAAVQAVSGDVELQMPGQLADHLTLNSKTALSIGQSLHVLPNSEAHLTLELNQGRVILTGPAALTVTESYRRATALGHLSDQFEREFVLTVDQTQGSARYVFANTDPAFTEVKITIRLPDRNYTPTEPCWNITINAANESTVETFPCP